MDPVRVLVVDDEALVRHALRIFLDSASRTELVGEAANGQEAVAKCRELRPDVVLMDIQMPIVNGIEATEQIVEEFPETRVLAVTTFSSERHVVAALQAGASGYLVKDTAPNEIVDAIQDVHEGKSVLSSQITRELVLAVRGSNDPDSSLAPVHRQSLTEREMSIVRLLANGLSNSEIAAELYLSEATVKSNLGRIMSKWAVRDRVQVLIHAAKSGLVLL